MVHVPYKGGPDAIQAVLKGDVCCIFNQVQTIMQQYRAGKVRLLGVTTKTRVAAIPEVPTIDESGLPGYESYTWFAIFGPKGLDAAIAQKFNAAIKVALADPQTQRKLAELGNTPRYETVEQFTATVKRDRARWAEVVKAVGAKVD
jgi:tripartite-type tricarboxylate transporter receptor subunit TctC